MQPQPIQAKVSKTTTDHTIMSKVLTRQSPNPIQRLSGAQNYPMGAHHLQYNKHAMQATQPNSVTASSFHSQSTNSFIRQPMLQSKTATTVIADAQPFELRKSTSTSHAKVMTFNLAKHHILQKSPTVLHQHAAALKHTSHQNHESDGPLPTSSSTTTTGQGAVNPNAPHKKKMLKLRTAQLASSSQGKDGAVEHLLSDGKHEGGDQNNQLTGGRGGGAENNNKSTPIARLSQPRASCKSQATSSHLNDGACKSDSNRARQKTPLRKKLHSSKQERQLQMAATGAAASTSQHDEEEVVIFKNRLDSLNADEVPQQLVNKKSSLLASQPAPFTPQQVMESRMQAAQLQAAQTFQTPQENTIQVALTDKGTASQMKKSAQFSKTGMIKISSPPQDNPFKSSMVVNSTKQQISNSSKPLKQSTIIHTPSLNCEKSAAAHALQLIVGQGEDGSAPGKQVKKKFVLDEKLLQHHHRSTMQPRTSKASNMNSPLRSPESFQLKTLLDSNDNFLKQSQTNLPPTASSNSQPKRKVGKDSRVERNNHVSTPAFKSEQKQQAQESGGPSIASKRQSMGSLLPRAKPNPSPMRISYEEFRSIKNGNANGSNQALQSALTSAMKTSQIIIPAAITGTPTATTAVKATNSVNSRKQTKNLLQQAQELKVYYVDQDNHQLGGSSAKPEQTTGKSSSAMRSRKNSQMADRQHVFATQAENLLLMHEKLSKLQLLQQQQQGATSNSKASKADRAHNEKQKKSKKAQLHESGQFSPTTSKLIKHFLSKQKTKEALIASLNGDRKSVPRKQSFLKDACQQKIAQKHHQISLAHQLAGPSTQSQRSLKQQRRGSVASNKESKHRDSASKAQHAGQAQTHLYRTQLASANCNSANAKEVSGAASTNSRKIFSRKGSASKQNGRSQHSQQHQQYQIMQIAHSGSSKKLIEKVKPPLQTSKNNFLTQSAINTHTSSPRQQLQTTSKFVLRQSKKRDSQSSANNDAQLSEKRMAFSQSVQQLQHQGGGHSSQQSQPKLIVKKLKHSKQQSQLDREHQLGSYSGNQPNSQNEVMRSIEKIQFHRSRKAPHAKSIQVSGSDSSSVLQTIVSINKHPYFAGENYSEHNAVSSEQPYVSNLVNQQNLASHSTKGDLLANSDTNALALTSDQTKTNKLCQNKSKQNSQSTSKNGQASSSKKGNKNSKSSVYNDLQEDERVRNFEPYGHPPVSPIGQSLFDNLNSQFITGNQTNLFSGRSSGEKLLDIVTKMQEDIISSQNPHTSKEALQQLKAMQGIIQSQENLIKQFQKDIHRQEEVITRYEKHIRHLEGSQRTSSQKNTNKFNEDDLSGFTEHVSSSLLNPSSNYINANTNLAFQRQGTEILAPPTQIFSPPESDRDGTVKYNLTEKSTPGKQQKKEQSPSEFTGAGDADEVEKAPLSNSQLRRSELVEDRPVVRSDKPSSQIQQDQSQVTGSNLKKAERGDDRDELRRFDLSERKIVLMEEKEHMRLKLRKKEKQERYTKQKINKLMFFFFTLQNKGVPVNEIYEQEGIKAIRTDRFDEIMAQIAKDNTAHQQQDGAEESKKPDQPNNQSEDEEYSFYTEDSYELLGKNPDIKMQAFQRPDNVPMLNLEGLPEYVSSSDEEEDDDEGEGAQNQEAHPESALKDPDAETGDQNDLQMQRQSMSQKDYRQSLQYIENYYQKHSIMPDEGVMTSSELEQININGAGGGAVDQRQNSDLNPFSTPDLIDTRLEEDEVVNGQMEPDESAVPVEIGGKKKKITRDAEEDKDPWNPLSTPQKLGNKSDKHNHNSNEQQQQKNQRHLQQHQHQQPIRMLDRCPSVLEKAEKNKLEILEQVTGMVAMKSNRDLSSLKDQHSERNHSSFQLSSLLSPPSKKPGYQQSQSMINNNKVDRFSSSSQPYQTSQNPSENQRKLISMASQSQSQLESIDMMLSHDVNTRESNYGGQVGR